MNAYELADGLDSKADTFTGTLLEDSATMLRQQAKRIEELEKGGHVCGTCGGWVHDEILVQPNNQEPVAWMSNSNDTIYSSNDIKEMKEGNFKETAKHFTIPLYTHPHKELSDEEIMEVLEKIEHTYDPYEIEMSFDYEIRIAKAIIKASRGEE